MASLMEGFAKAGQQKESDTPARLAPNKTSKKLIDSNTRLAPAETRLAPHRKASGPSSTIQSGQRISYTVKEMLHLKNSPLSAKAPQDLVDHAKQHKHKPSFSSEPPKSRLAARAAERLAREADPSRSLAPKFAQFDTDSDSRGRRIVPPRDFRGTGRNHDRGDWRDGIRRDRRDFGSSQGDNRAGPHGRSRGNPHRYEQEDDDEMPLWAMDGPMDTEFVMRGFEDDEERLKIEANARKIAAEEIEAEHFFELPHEEDFFESIYSSPKKGKREPDIDESDPPENSSRFNRFFGGSSNDALDQGNKSDDLPSLPAFFSHEPSTRGSENMDTTTTMPTLPAFFSNLDKENADDIAPPVEDKGHKHLENRKSEKVSLPAFFNDIDEAKQSRDDSDDRAADRSALMRLLGSGGKLLSPQAFINAPAQAQSQPAAVPTKQIPEKENALSPTEPKLSVLKPTELTPNQSTKREFNNPTTMDNGSSTMNKLLNIPNVWGSEGTAPKEKTTPSEQPEKIEEDNNPQTDNLSKNTSNQPPPQNDDTASLSKLLSKAGIQPMGAPIGGTMPMPSMFPPQSSMMPPHLMAAQGMNGMPVIPYMGHAPMQNIPPAMMALHAGLQQQHNQMGNFGGPSSISFVSPDQVAARHGYTTTAEPNQESKSSQKNKSTRQNSNSGNKTKKSKQRSFMPTAVIRNMGKGKGGPKAGQGDKGKGNGIANVSNNGNPQDVQESQQNILKLFGAAAGEQ